VTLGQKLLFFLLGAILALGRVGSGHGLNHANDREMK